MHELYHGSPHKLRGGMLIPKKAKDVGKRKENMHVAVYATDNREIAIAMAIISSKGMKASSLTLPAPYGRIYKGKPEQEEVYVYHLDSRDFEKQEGNKLEQWIAKRSVKPLSVEIINVKDYMHLVRDATEEEKKE